MSQEVRWHCFPDADTVAVETVQRILQAARAAIEARAAFRIVLAGGSTPLQVYRQLAGCDADWSRWHVYLGDERCLPADHGDRNSVMISGAWLDRARIPAGQIHWIPAEQGAETGAIIYDGVIRDAVPFDLVLLGMGEDGHTASLFPGHEHHANNRVVAVYNAPKPPPERISLNYATLGNTRGLLLLVTGSGKRAAVRQWRSGAALPVAGLECAAGVDVLCDKAACEG